MKGWQLASSVCVLAVFVRVDDAAREVQNWKEWKRRDVRVHGNSKARLLSTARQEAKILW